MVSNAGKCKSSPLPPESISDADVGLGLSLNPCFIITAQRLLRDPRLETRGLITFLNTPRACSLLAFHQPNYQRKTRLSGTQNHLRRHNPLLSVNDLHRFWLRCEASGARRRHCLQMKCCNTVWERDIFKWGLERLQTLPTICDSWEVMCGEQ